MKVLTDRWGLLRVGIVTGLFLLAGAVAGVIWQAVWDAPTGVVYADDWYLSPSGPDVGFSGTALYVLVASLTGLVAGLAISVLRGHETLTVLATVVAALVAGWLMYAVGHAMGPDDPRPMAQGGKDLTELPSDLTLAASDDSRQPWRSTALLAMPAGALAALSAVYVVGTHRGGRHVVSATSQAALKADRDR